MILEMSSWCNTSCSLRL